MKDIGGSIAFFRYYAGWADKIHGQTIEVSLTSLLHPGPRHSTRYRQTKTNLLTLDTNRTVLWCAHHLTLCRATNVIEHIFAGTNHTLELSFGAYSYNLELKLRLTITSRFIDDACHKMRSCTGSWECDNFKGEVKNTRIYRYVCYLHISLCTLAVRSHTSHGSQIRWFGQRSRVPSRRHKHHQRLR